MNVRAASGVRQRRRLVLRRAREILYRRLGVLCRNVDHRPLTALARTPLRTIRGADLDALPAANAGARLLTTRLAHAVVNRIRRAAEDPDEGECQGS